jgi:plastocyanin
VLAAALALAGCGSTSGSNDQADAITDASVVTKSVIAYSDKGFDSTAVTIAAGEAVAFVNNGTTEHSWTGRTGEELVFDSGVQRVGDRFTWRSTTPGAVTVADKADPGTTMTITVTPAR